MRNLASAIYVFSGGFVIMVLEIIGARFLAKDFGSAFYVWISQIGVVLIALALGYFVGGVLGDRFRKLSFLSWILVITGLYTFFMPGFEIGTDQKIRIPGFAQPLLDSIVLRHDTLDIPIIWQKLDPAMGSAVLFLLPCFVLAMISPYMIRIASTQLIHVGKISGLVYAFSTFGSIAGVFVSGYVLIDLFRISHIIAVMGIMIILMGLVAPLIDKLFLIEEINKKGER